MFSVEDKEDATVCEAESVISATKSSLSESVSVVPVRDRQQVDFSANNKINPGYHPVVSDGHVSCLGVQRKCKDLRSKGIGLIYFGFCLTFLF